MAKATFRIAIFCCRAIRFKSSLRFRFATPQFRAFHCYPSRDLLRNKLSVFNRIYGPLKVTMPLLISILQQ